MAKKSTSNYTEEMTVRMVEAYQACGESASEADQQERDNVVKQFATEFGFHPASIRGKLVREGVYIKKTNLTKQGKTPESKGDIVSEIAGFLQKTEEYCDSLSKSNKAVLQDIRDALTPEPEVMENSEEEGEAA